MMLTFKFCSVFCLISSINSTVGQIDGYCKSKKDKNEECGEHSFEIIRPMLEYFNDLNIEKKSTTKELLDLRKQLSSTTQELNELTKKYEDNRNRLNLIFAASDALTKNYEDCKASKVLSDMHISNSQSKTKGAPTTCAESENYSGSLQLQLQGVNDFRVSCDAKVAGSGWTVIQRRTSGSISFNQKWEDYKAGFGYVDADLFIGLERLHILTKSQRYELYIQLIDQSNEIRFARYDNFVVESEEEGYKQSSVGQYSGNSEDSLSAHVGSKFSTKDRDNDTDSFRNCAEVLKGGWWYFDCAHSNLNGKSFNCRLPEDTPNIEKYGCIYWQRWHGRGYSLSQVQMMIRPWDYKA